MQLGRIKKVPIREQWKNEEYDFTPWLAQEQNILLLSEEINIELEVEDTEVSIGAYKADIVAKSGDGSTVIIENQLEKTDHKHLGQIITYASGVEASVVIWICNEVTDEHRQAIDWLNKITVRDVVFFACEMELWQIDDSLPAPRFHIIASPNDWTKAVKSTSSFGPLSITKQGHLDFWNSFKEFMDESGTQLRMRTPRPQHWYTLAVGRSKFNISLTTNTLTNTVGCEIYIRGKNAKSAYAKLLEHKDAIEVNTGKLNWLELPDGQDCRIKQSIDGDTKDKNQWPKLHNWLKAKSELFTEVFSPIIKDLDYSEQANPSE